MGILIDRKNNHYFLKTFRITSKDGAVSENVLRSSSFSPTLFEK